MAQIDSNIYFQQETPDIMGGVIKGLAIKDMVDKRKSDQKSAQESEAIKNAYKLGVVTNQDGSLSVDKSKTLSALAAINPQKAIEAQQQFAAQDESQRSQNLQKQRDQIDMIARLAGSATDQRSYEAAIGEAGKYGLDVSQMPRAFDPGLMRSYQVKALTAKEQLDNQLKQQEMKIKEQELGIKVKNQALARDDKKQKAYELNASQAKQLGLHKIGLEAEQQYQKATKDKSAYDPTSSGQWIDNSTWAWNWMKNDKAIEAQAAQDAWVEAYLRDASGAAIPPSERGAYAKDYFPQPGDTPAVVKNKTRLRQQKSESSLIGAGPGANSKFMNQSQSYKPSTVTQNGHTYTLNPETGEYE